MFANAIYGMYAELNKTLLSVLDFEESDLEEFQKIATPLSIKRGDRFIKIGQSIHRIGFILEGIFEMTYVNAKEVETVIDFFFPGNFVVDYVSYLTNSAAETDIRAVSDATLLIFERKSLDKLYDKNIRFQKFGRLMAENQFVQFAKRLREGSLPPAERYYKLMAENKQWIQEISQYKIASYLNISPEWLSKIRKGK